MEIDFTGIIIGLATFLTIGLFHPLVIKAEYYWGAGCWWLVVVPAGRNGLHSGFAFSARHFFHYIRCGGIQQPLVNTGTCKTTQACGKGLVPERTGT